MELDTRVNEHLDFLLRITSEGDEDSLFLRSIVMEAKAGSTNRGRIFLKLLKASYIPKEDILKQMKPEERTLYERMEARRKESGSYGVGDSEIIKKYYDAILGLD